MCVLHNCRKFQCFSGGGCVVISKNVNKTKLPCTALMGLFFAVDHSITDAANKLAVIIFEAS